MNLQFMLLLSILGFAACSTCDSLTTRLPKHAKPTNYLVWLSPNLTTGEVDGKVTIQIAIMAPTNRIVVHAKDLTLSYYYITINRKAVNAEFIPCVKFDYWVFKFDQIVKKGDEVKLFMDYDFQISNGLFGLYYGSVDKKSIVTQFEADYARMMLPCFDEPNFKATFDVSIVRNSLHTALSNTQVARSVDFGCGSGMDTFKTTPKMSTYLLAIAVLDGYAFKTRMTTKTEKPIEVRLFAPIDKIGEADFGLYMTIHALEYFEKYTNVSYPLEKLDALPVTLFRDCAMENWGLMIFEQSSLLSEDTNRNIAQVVCHEVAHQWFGNIVTMDWWDELYLNEGFTSYMQYKCLDDIFPSEKIANNFIGPWAFIPDDQIRPVIYETHDMGSLFDWIPFYKAPAIIHMVAETVGQSNFQMAMREYLKNNLYSNTKSVDVWSVVEKYSKDYYTGPVSLQSFVHGWNTMVGHPVVRFEVKNGIATVYNQTKLSMNGRGEASNWTIPLFYRTNQSEERKLEWMGPEARNVRWNVGTANWVILNTEKVGYYKVLYDEGIYKKFAKQLKEDHTKFTPAERQGLLADTFLLVKANYLDDSVYKSLISWTYLYNEENEKVRELLMNQLLDSYKWTTWIWLDFINLF